jgi:hypothetical protein
VEKICTKIVTQSLSRIHTHQRMKHFKWLSNGDSGHRRSDHRLAVGVQFDFPSSPAGVALAQANIELGAIGTHVLSSTAVIQADEIVLKRL